MAKILIAYASMSGNTEDIANLIQKSIAPFNHDVEVKELENMEAEELLDYDGILLGSYTWGDGDLPYEAEDFYDAMEGLDLSGKQAATFGSGDTVYPEFCAAVDLLEERLKACGADVAQAGLKVEFAPETEEDIERCVSFAIQFCERIDG